MSDNIYLTANKSKKTSFEFDLEIQGTNVEDVDITLFVDKSEFVLGFPATHQSGDTWSVTIPSLESLLELGEHSFYINVIVDDTYCFTPIKDGTIEVIDKDPKINIKSDKNVQPSIMFKNTTDQEDQEENQDSADTNSSNRQAQKPEDTKEQQEQQKDKQKTEEQHEDSLPERFSDYVTSSKRRAKKVRKKAKTTSQASDKHQNESKNPTHQFFPQGSPKRIAEQIRNMDTLDENQKDKAVREILKGRNFKKD